MKKEFEAESPLGKTIRLDESQWRRIVSEKHPRMKGKIDEIERTIEFPNQINKSYKDPHIAIYFREIEGTSQHFYGVVVKHENGTGFVITTYISDNKSGGEILWPR